MATRYTAIATAALIAGAAGTSLYTASTAQQAREAIVAAHDPTTRHGELAVRVDAGGADVTALAAVDPGTPTQVLTVSDSGVPVWRASASALPSGTGFVTVSSGTGGVLTASTTSAADLRAALRVVDTYAFADATGVTLSSGDGTAAVTGGVLRCSVGSGVSPATTARPQGVVQLSSSADPWALDVSARIAAYGGTVGTRRAALSISSVARGLDTSLYGTATWSIYVMQMNATDLQVWDYIASTGPTLRGATGVTMSSDGQDWLRVRLMDGYVRVFHGRGSSRPTSWQRVYEAPWGASSGASVVRMNPPTTVTLGAYRSSADAEVFTVDWDDLSVEYPLWSTR